jgi:hypothetical protein
MMHALTYWVLQAVREHGPVSRAALQQLLPAMNPERLDRRLYNLVSLGYVRRCLVPQQADVHFVATGRTPANEEGLQALLGTTPAVDVPRAAAAPAAPADPSAEAEAEGDDEPQDDAPATAAPRPPVPVGSAALHNHWTSTNNAWPQRPLVVRPGALDARRLSSVRFGRIHDCVERSLGVVEAGRRQADPAQP